MTDDQSKEITRLLIEQSTRLGEISGRQEAILSEQETIRRLVEKSEEVAAESRGKMREGLQFLSSQMSELTRRVEVVEAHAERSEDFMQRASSMEARWGATWAVLSWIGRRTWAVVAAAAVAAWAYRHDIWAWLSSHAN